MSRHHPEKLTAKQEQGIAALLASPTVRQAAESIKVNERTIWSWLATPLFKAAYEEARAGLVDEVKNVWMLLAKDAHTGIKELLDSPETPAAVKLKAYLMAIDRVVPPETVQPPEQQSPLVIAELLPFVKPEELSEIKRIMEQARTRKLEAEQNVSPMRKQA